MFSVLLVAFVALSSAQNVPVPSAISWICDQRNSVNAPAFPRHWCDDSVPVCQWKGVACLRNDRVVSAEISDVPLQATVGPELLTPGVTRLTVRNCSLSGEIASPFGGVTSLDISHNHLSGTLPLDFFKDLLSVDISHNKFVSLGNVCEAPMLHKLCADQNELTDDLTECAAHNFFFTQYMHTLTLAGNSLSGTAPMPSNVTVYNIANNQFIDVVDARPLGKDFLNNFHIPGKASIALTKNGKLIDRTIYKLRKCMISGNIFTEQPAWMRTEGEHAGKVCKLDE